jgi:ribosomal protein S6--L-glutamate ligase
MAGVPVVNPSWGIALARDKLSSAQALLAQRIPVPPTVLVRQHQALLGAVRRVGGFPVVVKVLRGTHGVGVMLAGSMQELAFHAQALWQAGQEVLLQAFLAEAGGQDYRAFVVDGSVVAAMVRRAKPGDFRANVHQGADVFGVDLEPAMAALAIKAAAALGLGLCGVDLMHAGHQAVVLEVNASPGLRGIERATGKDVAGAVMRWVARLGRTRAWSAQPRPSAGAGEASTGVTPVGAA